MSRKKEIITGVADLTEDAYHTRITKLEEELKKLKEEAPKFKVGDELVFKENLMIVRVVEVKKKHKRYIYGVNYRHKHVKGDTLGKFFVEEYNLDEIPFNYENMIFEAYLDYRCKYENLIKEITRPYRENKIYLEENKNKRK